MGVALMVDSVVYSSAMGAQEGDNVAHLWDSKFAVSFGV